MAREARSARAPFAAPEGPVSFPRRERDAQGDAYLLVLETDGDRERTVEGRPPEPPLRELQRLEIEYRELPVENRQQDAYRLLLEGLRHELKQRNPNLEREIELASDRLRVTNDGDETLDLKGAQPRQDLTPRKLLGRVFAVVSSIRDDPDGRVVVRPSGGPVARRFLETLPLRQAIGYSRLLLPEGRVQPGATWRALRFPAAASGALGLGLDVTYTLAGFEPLEGVPCAWILLRAEQDATDVTSRAGFEFDRVEATLEGAAWVELATSRLRRLVIDDEVQLTYTRGRAPVPTTTERLYHKSRLRLELRDPEARPTTWADGTKRFEKR